MHKNLSLRLHFLRWSTTSKYKTNDTTKRSGENRSKTGRNRSKSTKADQYRPKPIEIDRNRSKSIETDQNRSKSTKIDRNRPKSIKLDRTRPINQTRRINQSQRHPSMGSDGVLPSPARRFRLALSSSLTRSARYCTRTWFSFLSERRRSAAWDTYNNEQNTRPQWAHEKKKTVTSGSTQEKLSLSPWVFAYGIFSLAIHMYLSISSPQPLITCIAGYA